MLGGMPGTSPLRRIASRLPRPDAARRIAAAEVARAPAAARAAAGLTPASLALAGVRIVRSPRTVNLVLPDATPARRFAGVDTALRATAGIARRLGAEVRIVETNLLRRRRAARRVDAGLLAQRFDDIPARLTPRETIGDTGFGSDDLWIATHWTTAHALQVAATAGTLDPDRVVYLIQDYEPGFTAWSSDHVLASDTYAAGFRPLVNSTPVAQVLAARAGVHVDPAAVFAPALDLPRLERIAAARDRAPRTRRVRFYARPSKPRNLFPLGMAVVRAARRRLGGDVEFVLAGEPVRPEPGIRSMGRLGWDEYFAVLAGSDVVLSLQLSAHPSHPPLEAAISGALAVTNDLDGTRAGLHPRLRAVPASLAALTEELLLAVDTAHDVEPGYLPLAPGALGVPLETALDTLTARL